MLWASYKRNNVKGLAAGMMAGGLQYVEWQIVVHRVYDLAQNGFLLLP
jgi:hypothetical protein